MNNPIDRSLDHIPLPPTTNVSNIFPAESATSQKVSLAAGSAFNAIRALKKVDSDPFTISKYLNADTSLDSTTLDSTAIDFTPMDSAMFMDAEISDIVNNLSNNIPVKQKTKLAILAESKWTGAKRTINALVQSHLRKYYSTGCTELKGSLKNKFDKKGPYGKKIKAQFVKIDQGISETALLMVNGKKEYVVKKLALPEQLMGRKSVKEDLAAIFVEGLKNYGDMVEKLDEFLSEKITVYFDKQIAPYYTGANREKMAELVGKGLEIDVPEVEIIKAKGDKVYTSHKFIENQGSLGNLLPTYNAGAIDVQSMQDIYILDALLKNVDRHLNNILISEDNKAIPIDHSLSLQGSRKSLNSSIYTAMFNASLSLQGHSSLPLTRESIEKIRKFDVNQVIAKATITEKLILEVDVKNELRERAARAKEAIKIPGITAEQFMYAVVEPLCLEALQKNPDLVAKKLAAILTS